MFLNTLLTHYLKKGNCMTDDYVNKVAEAVQIRPRN